MKKLILVAAVVLSVGLAAGCKKKMSGRGPERPGGDAADSGGCCQAGGAEGALAPLGLGVIGLGFVLRRRR